MIVGDVFQPFVARLYRAAIDDDLVRICQMVEQGRQLFFEQREPMLHSRQPASVADCLIQRIAGCRCAELFAVSAAETLDAVFIKQCLAGREQQMRFENAGAGLCRGIEQPQAFKFVTEKVEAQPLFQPRREYVDD